MHPFQHAQISAKKFGGVPEDYTALHTWFDESKAHIPDFRHRALRHHAEGIFMAERFFGVTIRISTGKQVPVRLVGEQHVKDDLGFIPTLHQWLSNIMPTEWMQRGPFARTHMTDSPVGEPAVEAPVN